MKDVLVSRLGLSPDSVTYHLCDLGQITLNALISSYVKYRKTLAVCLKQGWHCMLAIPLVQQASRSTEFRVKIL